MENTREEQAQSVEKKYCIIANPTSGKKRNGRKNLETLKNFFIARKANFSVHETQSAHDATRIARALTESGETELIVVGGDGTLHEVLNGIAEPSACNLGIVPSGTGNDFAECIGLPYDVETAAKVILDGEAKTTDYIEVSGVRCMNVSGLGMDVDVLERCQRGKMKGKMKYLMSLLQSLFAFKGYKVEIESEGKTETRDALIAAVCNGNQFGGGIRICPVADPADGKMNTVIVDCIGGKLQIIKAFMQLMKGKILSYPAASHFTCDRVRFTPASPCTVQLDGELYKDLPFDACIRSGLKVYRP